MKSRKLRKIEDIRRITLKITTVTSKNHGIQVDPNYTAGMKIFSIHTCITYSYVIFYSLIVFEKTLKFSFVVSIYPSILLSSALVAYVICSFSWHPHACIQNLSIAHITGIVAKKIISNNLKYHLKQGKKVSSNCKM